jgi:DNA-binding transcriptional MerR regulator
VALFAHRAERRRLFAKRDDLQIDIIPSRAGYAGVSIEDTVALADESLRHELAQAYPELWQRIVTRHRYIRERLGIALPEEVLPLSNTVGYLRPGC